MREKRALGKAGDLVRNKARGAEAMVENFRLDLGGVGVGGEGKLDAEVGCAIEGIGIVREENVGHVAADEGLKLRERLDLLASCRALALIVNADEIELRAPKRELGIFLAEKLQTGLSKEALRFLFGAGVNFVVAIAAPDAKRRAQPANFVDAISERVTSAGDEVAGNNREIGAELVGHVHGAANLSARHVPAQMNITKLDDLHTVKRGRKIGHGNLDAANRVLEALGGKAVGCKEKRRNTCDCSGALEEVTARGIAEKFHGAVGPGSGLSRVDWPERGGRGAREPPQQNPEPGQALDKDHGEKCK